MTEKIWYRTPVPSIKLNMLCHHIRDTRPICVCYSVLLRIAYSVNSLYAYQQMAE